MPPKTKRGPGRPPNKPQINTDVKGIVELPYEAQNRLEFVHNDPDIFKSLFSYFKNIKAKDIHFRCTRTNITLFARDHTKTSRVVAIIDCAQVTWFYCNDTFYFSLNRESVEKIFSSIDKSFSKISIIQSLEDISAVDFVFKDIILDKECRYKVVVSQYQEDIDLYDAEQTNDEYPIEFNLTSKQIKKSLNDASNYSDTITIEKIGLHPLQLSYNKANISYNEIYNVDDKIALKTKTETDDYIFRITVKIANIKSIAASMVTDDMKVCCKENGDILFKTILDPKVLVVNTYVRIN
jgi:hypothetical protein